MTVESPKVHFWLALTICAVCISFLVFTGIDYAQAREAEDDAIWLFLLFILPAVLQMLGLWALYRRVGHDKRVWKFYWFYLVWMFFCIVSYTYMWSRYTSYIAHKVRPGPFFLYLSACLVLFFLIPVAGMTYTLTARSELKNQPDSGRIRKLWEHCILLKDMKSSVLEVPYWALLFFFSLFLGISFLFSFAFAFHDKREFPSPKEEKVPALYKPKIYSTDPAERQQALVRPSLSNGSEFAYDQEMVRSFTFYFDSESALFITNDFDSRNRDRRLPKEQDKRSWDWRGKANESHLKQLVDHIITEPKNKEARLRILLLGQTDDNAPRKNYPDNHALSGARANNMRTVILNRLAEKDHTWRDIDWNYQGLSNEKPVEPVTLSDFRQELVPLINELGGHNKLWERTNVATLTDYLRRIVELGRRELSQSEGAALCNKVRDAINEMNEIDKAPKSDEEKTKLTDNKLRGIQDQLRDVIESFELVDKDARRRVVVASIVPFQAKPSRLIDYTELKLIDYVYFVGYTITTTGYGDIVPISSYAKFLCTSANILEVFFLVVFFNALLSIRKDKDIIMPIRAAFNADPNVGTVKVTVPSNLSWEASTADTWITITSGRTGSGNGTVKYSILANPNLKPRPGKITIAGNEHYIEQEGTKCNYSFVQRRTALSAAEGNYEIEVKASDDCSWNAKSEENWIIITAGQSGSGNGKVKYRALANPGPNKRIGRITVAGQIYTVEQRRP